VYRCTYDNDKDWELCMKRIYEDVRYSMEFTIGHQHLLDERCFRLTVMEDKSQFDEAVSSDVRQHFQN
jgi:hypothetical protein